jgi:hypothetical protein
MITSFFFLLGLVAFWLATKRDDRGLSIWFAFYLVFLFANIANATAREINDRMAEWHECTQGNTDIKVESCDVFYMVPWLVP